MAKPDGTYYWPSEDGFAPKTEQDRVLQLNLHVHLQAGSGYAKATVEAQDPVTGEWTDVTSEVSGWAWWKAYVDSNHPERADRVFHLVDSRRFLSAFDAVRLKIELDTDEANDADYDCRLVWR